MLRFRIYGPSSSPCSYRPTKNFFTNIYLFPPFFWKIRIFCQWLHQNHWKSLRRWRLTLIFAIHHALLHLFPPSHQHYNFFFPRKWCNSWKVSTQICPSTWRQCFLEIQHAISSLRNTYKFKVDFWYWNKKLLATCEKF